MPATEETPALPKRPYAAPALVVHGDVSLLTLGKTGNSLDQDNGGSFIPQSDT